MRRYTFITGQTVEDPDGAWVRYRDVETIVRIAAEQAERHDRFLAALSRIAYPSKWSFVGREAVATARRAIGK